MMKVAARREEIVVDSDEKEEVNSDNELRRLRYTLEQTSLNGFIAPARQFSGEDRMRDMDVLYAELVNDAMV